MTARTTMADLITTLRGFTNAGTADFAVGSNTYWSDDQLQAALDRYAVQVRNEVMQSFPVTVTGGSVNWFDYQSNMRFFEKTDGGTVRFIVKDGVGTVQGTALWSADYEKGLVIFAANTQGSVYTVTGYSYDVYAAAADVWYQKAAHASEMIDFSTDNHSVKRAHIAAAALKMAQRYENMAITNVSSVSTIERGDLNVCGGYSD